MMKKMNHLFQKNETNKAAYDYKIRQNSQKLKNNKTPKNNKTIN